MAASVVVVDVLLDESDVADVVDDADVVEALDDAVVDEVESVVAVVADDAASVAEACEPDELSTLCSSCKSVCICAAITCWRLDVVALSDESALVEFESDELLCDGGGGGGGGGAAAVVAAEESPLAVEDDESSASVRFWKSLSRVCTSDARLLDDEELSLLAEAADVLLDDEVASELESAWACIKANCIDELIISNAVARSLSVKPSEAEDEDEDEDEEDVEDDWEDSSLVSVS